MIDLDKQPSARDLVVFASLLPLFFAALGAIQWQAGSSRVAATLWLIGAGLSSIALLLPKARRWLYLGWMYALYPVAWMVSRLLLAAVFFLVVSPIAFALRAAGRDPMTRGFDKTAPTYWVLREPKTRRGRYFRQF